MDKGGPDESKIADSDRRVQVAVREGSQQKERILDGGETEGGRQKIDHIVDRLLDRIQKKHDQEDCETFRYLFDERPDDILLRLAFYESCRNAFAIDCEAD